MYIKYNGSKFINTKLNIYKKKSIEIKLSNFTFIFNKDKFYILK